MLVTVRRGRSPATVPPVLESADVARRGPTGVACGPVTVRRTAPLPATRPGPWGLGLPRRGPTAGAREPPPPPQPVAATVTGQAARPRVARRGPAGPGRACLPPLRRVRTPGVVGRLGVQGPAGTGAAVRGRRFVLDRPTDASGPQVHPENRTGHKEHPYLARTHPGTTPNGFTIGSSPLYHGSPPPTTTGLTGEVHFDRVHVYGRGSS